MFETRAGAARGDARGHAPAAGADRAVAACARCSATSAASAALTLAGAPHGGAGALLDDAVVAALDALDRRRRAGRRGTRRAGRRCARASPAALAETTARIVAQAVEILDAARDVRLALDALPRDDALRPARLDVAAQVGGLVYPGFVAATGAERLADVDALPAGGASRRLERLPDAPAADRDRMTVVHELEAQLRRRREAAGGAPSPALREVGWMLQELRVSELRAGRGRARSDLREAGTPRAGGERRRST